MRTILLCFILILPLAHQVRAGIDTSRQALGIIKIYPFQFGERYIAYEHVLDRKHTIEAGAGYIRQAMMASSGMFGLPQPHEASGFAVRLQYKKYITKKNIAPFGFYLAPKLTYRNIKVFYNEYTPDTILSPNGIIKGHGRFDVLALHGMLGLQGRIFERLSFHFETGLGARVKHVSSISGEPFYFHDLMVGREVKSSGSMYPSWYWSPSFQYNFSLGFVLYKNKK